MICLAEDPAGKCPKIKGNIDLSSWLLPKPATKWIQQVQKLFVRLPGVFLISVLRARACSLFLGNHWWMLQYEEPHWNTLLINIIIGREDKVYILFLPAYLHQVVEPYEQFNQRTTLVREKRYGGKTNHAINFIVVLRPFACHHKKCRCCLTVPNVV